MAEGKFVTAINCMDGRTQVPVIEWMKKEYGADYVDSITEPGPVKILAEAPDSSPAKSMMGRTAISVDKHGSTAIAVIIHHACAGNPVDEATQRGQLVKALETVKAWSFGVEVIGLWVNGDWQVERVD